MRGNQPIDRVANIDADLLAQVLAQAARTLRGPLDGRFDVVAAAGPVPEPPQIAVAGAIMAAVAALAGSGLPVLGGVARDLADPAGELLRKRHRSVRRRRPRLAGAGRRLVALRLAKFQKRVLLDLGLDEFAQFQVRQLQQLYRLLQLRRQNQRLALPKLQTLRKADFVHKMLRRGGAYRLNRSPR